MIMIMAVILGLWISWDGLYARMFNHYAFPNALWLRLLDHWGIEPLELAWPLIVVGTSWFGALAGLWLRQAWSPRAVIILALLSTFYLWGGTFLALIILVASSLPAARNWVIRRDD